MTIHNFEQLPFHERLTRLAEAEGLQYTEIHIQ